MRPLEYILLTHDCYANHFNVEYLYGEPTGEPTGEPRHTVFLVSDSTVLMEDMQVISFRFMDGPISAWDGGTKYQCSLKRGAVSYART